MLAPVPVFAGYNPAIGRWTSRDPLEDAEISQGPNLYIYVVNNPINSVDPLGLFYEGPNNPSTQGGEALSHLWNLDPCLRKCVKEHYGLTATGAGMVAAGAELIPKAAKAGAAGSTHGTSVASIVLEKVLPMRVSSTWAPTLNNPFARSAVVGRIGARWLPVAGWGVLAYDVNSIRKCIEECEKEKKCSPNGGVGGE